MVEPDFEDAIIEAIERIGGRTPMERILIELKERPELTHLDNEQSRAAKVRRRMADIPLVRKVGGRRDATYELVSVSEATSESAAERAADVVAAAALDEDSLPASHCLLDEDKASSCGPGVDDRGVASDGESVSRKMTGRHHNTGIRVKRERATPSASLTGSFSMPSSRSQRPPSSHSPWMNTPP